MTRIHLAFMAILAALAIVVAPAAQAKPDNHTLDQLCMNIAYAHHHRALCANAENPPDYN